MHAARRCAPSARALALAAIGLGLGLAAWAGRPLAVDDAGTNDVGRGHIEAWAERADGLTAWTIAPAYAPRDGLEFSAGWSQLSGGGPHATALGFKWRITPSRDAGCNLGLSGGVERISGGGGRSTLLTLLGTCNAVAGGSVHVNLGLEKPSGASAVQGWGLAYEHPLGEVVPHVEWFGSEGAKPTVQLGLRGDIAPNWQLDGTVGRSDGLSIVSVGLKFGF